MSKTHDTYEIKLPQFEGPFDLLLFFIERDELDIYDIPIAKITNDFLEYIHQATLLNIELASEFILVASTLMRIKAKLLLPRKELDEQGKEIDPREELVQKLIEYRQLKTVLEELKILETEQSMKFKRGFVADEMKHIQSHVDGNEDLETVTLYKLMKAFQRVLTKFDNRTHEVKHTINQYPFTIESQKNIITHIVKSKLKAGFDDLFQQCTSRIEAIFNFLALLEMIQQQQLSLIQGLEKNNFWITAFSNEINAIDE